MQLQDTWDNFLWDGQFCLFVFFVKKIFLSVLFLVRFTSNENKKVSDQDHLALISFSSKIFQVPFFLVNFW